MPSRLASKTTMASALWGTCSLACFGCGGRTTDGTESAISWTIAVDDLLLSDVAPTADGGLLVAGTTSDGKLYAASLDANGHIAWESRLWEGQQASANLPAIAAGERGSAVVVGGRRDAECVDGCTTVISLDARGETRWEQRLAASMFAGDVSTQGGGILVSTLSSFSALSLIGGARVFESSEPHYMATALIRYASTGEAVGTPVVLRSANLAFLSHDSAGAALASGNLFGPGAGPGIPGWVDIAPGTSAGNCGIVASLGSDPQPSWARTDCDASVFDSRVTGIMGGSAVIEASPGGAPVQRSLVALDDAGEVRWSLPVPEVLSLARADGGGLFAASNVVFEVDASGRAVWQWPGELSDGDVEAPATGGFCDGKVTQAGPGEVFLTTRGCRSARALLGAEPLTETDFNAGIEGTLIAKLRPEDLAPFERGCGNGWVDPGEDCEAGAVGDASCETVKGTRGDLRCGVDCRYDTSGCSDASVCGDGIVEGDEECDAANVGAATCGIATMGTRPVGPLTCSADCRMDTRDCVAGGTGGAGAGGGGTSGSSSGGTGGAP